MIEDEVIADVIDDAADYIEKYGWNKGDLYGRHKVQDGEYPPACVMGGLMTANTDDSTGHSRIMLYHVVRRFQEVIPEIKAMAAWNDHAAKDVQEVLDTMRLASKRIRGSHD